MESGLNLYNQEDFSMSHKFQFVMRKNRTLAQALVAVIVSAVLPLAAFAAPTVEVLHWWTSGGESKAVQSLMQEFSDNGGTWTDMPVAGGGGDAAMTTLKARVLAGDPPTAVQLKGPSIQEWAEEGALAYLDDVGQAEGWDDVLPPQIAALS